MHSFLPYGGSLRKLVIAFDVGTTFSGVSFAILEPGEVPQVRSVLRYPGQVTGDFKIPSIIQYIPEGSGWKVAAVGAEADDECFMPAGKDQKLVLVQWFKLHLCPPAVTARQDIDLKLKPLPEGLTIVRVFGDFLKYLFDCTTTYIQETHPTGELLWGSIKDDFDVILSHPNGWEVAQQAQMREAAVHAGLIPEALIAEERLQFISEGEASVNYCFHLSSVNSRIEAGTSAMVIDAGGGTVDISSYCFESTSPLALKEIAPSECLLQGSVTIDMLFEKMLRKRLANSKYNKDSDILAMMKPFEQAVKRRFKDVQDKFFLQFGTNRDEDKAVNIKNGQLSLSGFAAAKLFTPCTSAILGTVKSQHEAATENISLAFLVGGFAASPWLFSQLKESLQAHGISLSRPEAHTNKAVAEGAIVHYLGRYVTARIARWTIGTVCGVDFDENDQEHVARRDQCKHRPSGVLTVSCKFSPLLVKGTSYREDDIAFRSLAREHAEETTDEATTAQILVYRGTKECPKWTDEEPNLFERLCIVRADTTAIPPSPCNGQNGAYFMKIFDVVLECGKTQLKAYLRWKVNGESEEKRGAAEIVYPDDKTSATP